MGQLSKDQKRFISMNLELGISNTELARKFGVTEGTIRYHKKRNKEGISDGRKNRYSEVSRFTTPIENWIHENLPADRERNTILSLYRILKEFHNYKLSYDALRRYVRKHYPEIMKKSYHLRVETPPGKFSQVDWKEKVSVQMGTPGNWMNVNFLIVQLSLSRKPAIVVRERRDQQSYLSGHHEAVKKLGGATEYYRPDCMATAVKIWNGRSSRLNEDYERFLGKLGAKGFPARPGTATDKGKVEKKIQDIFRDTEFRRIVFRDMKDLQDYIDKKVEEHCERTICPTTGTFISEAYGYEKKYLKQLKEVEIEIPIETTTTPVQKGSVVWFKGNYYQIPEGYEGKRVRCVNTGSLIKIFHGGELLETYSYRPELKGMVRISKVAAELSKRPMSDLVKSWWLEVAERQLDYYQEITGAAR